MKTEYKHIYFAEQEAKTKTKKFFIKNKDSECLLGEVKWYAPWRKYCLFPEPYKELVFCTECLADIQDFINNLMLEWRKARNE